MGVGEAKLGLDRDLEDGDDLAVEEIEDVGEQKKGEDPVAETSPWLSFGSGQKFTPSDSQTWRGAP